MENRYSFSDSGTRWDLIRSENPTASAPEEQAKLYVAVGEDATENESTLLWAVRNSGGRKLCILHVHQPAEIIPIMGRNHHMSTLPGYKVKEHRDTEKQYMINALGDCVRFCQKLGVSAEKLFAERESVERGILEMISLYRIEKLVMGAAADKSSYRHMTEPVCKRATYVQLHAPVSCNIWFIYRGQLVYERESLFQFNQHTDERLPSLQASSSNATRTAASSSSQTSSQNHDQVSSSSNSQPDLTAEDGHYGPLTQALIESGKARQGLLCGDFLWCQTFQLEAIFRLNESERSHLEELRRRKETEEELENLRSKYRRITEELQLTEDKIATYDQRIKDLERVALFKSEPLSAKEGNRGKFIDPYGETSSRKDTHRFLTEVSFNEIIKATCDLDPLLKIREVGYESVYRGKLSETDVAIKIHKPDETEFQREVEVLSKFRHPNLITLMGVCSEAWALVYEYLPNGTLEDRLICKDNTPALTWKTRISLAAELCSALIFIHSCEPFKLVHAALKPSCIYLDANFSCKIGDFRSSQMIPVGGNTTRDNSALVSSVYTDPEFVASREFCPDMDVYSFGLILLKLLTGLTALRLVEKVKSALTTHELEQILDTSAGEWPSMQAKQLAHLGLSCCEHTSDLKLDVWPVLEQMRRKNSDSVESAPSQPDEPPLYFFCPILQEPMKDPHVAADGFTYEAEALREWLNTGHNTSPMTNLPLPHLNLVPNLALRSAIKEWQDQHREHSEQ